ncbi:response regulator transcription factor [Rossellomorea vietnamensis]|uniref:LuxR family transcriptional regulator n=1 Tax=Rossellomorea vietnamensis TaxID=218284 RepID=A0A0P6W283_9BACI|nr:LuxR C-terminal-related transcriptional regulator [Rossellomorea vietnamensis]KPL59253.1 LuxR family transcriptional regulator [Rossellomorea vietnamensis]
MKSQQGKLLNTIETTIIEMIANEMPNKEIASELNYSQRMVEYHINKISKKLDVQTRVGIIVKAYRNRILT